MSKKGGTFRQARDFLKPNKTLSSSDLTSAPAPLHVPFNRKNLGAVGLRKWVRFDQNGETSVVQADKHSLTHELGVQLRDLRLLDPQMALSYPSAILCREKALVVNLEHIKCIITTDYILVLNADEENVISFIEEIQRRLTPPEKPAILFTRSSSCGNLKDGQTKAPHELTQSALPRLGETPF